MVTRVIHLSFLYTAALLLQSGRPQLIPSQHFEHDEYHEHDEHSGHSAHDGAEDIDTYTSTGLNVSADPDTSTHIDIPDTSTHIDINTNINTNTNTDGEANQGLEPAVYDWSSPEVVPFAVDPLENHDDIDAHGIGADVQSAALLDHETLTGPAVVDDDIYYDPTITVGDYEGERVGAVPGVAVAASPVSSSPTIIISEGSQAVPAPPATSVAPNWFGGPEIVDEHHRDNNLGGEPTFEEHGSIPWDITWAAPSSVPSVTSNLRVGESTEDSSTSGTHNSIPWNITWATPSGVASVNGNPKIGESTEDGPTFEEHSSVTWNITSATLSEVSSLLNNVSMKGNAGDTPTFEEHSSIPWDITWAAPSSVPSVNSNLRIGESTEDSSTSGTHNSIPWNITWATPSGVASVNGNPKIGESTEDGPTFEEHSSVTWNITSATLSEVSSLLNNVSIKGSAGDSSTSEASLSVAGGQLTYDGEEKLQ